MFKIGSHVIRQRAVLAPMAGVTDLPFRRLCRRLGAGMTISEMVTADTRLWNTDKSRRRLPHSGEPEPNAVQIAGADPGMVAEATRRNADLGARIIDINMGCPAKKVCRRAAGSALLRDEKLVAEILRAAVTAVDIPVTLKIRTGWCPNTKNAVAIARLAENCGIRALAVHGRTRACRFTGPVEYETIAAVVDAVGIPVIANGDIDSPQKAKSVLDHTGAAAVMIGRGAQGRPWLFRAVNHFLNTGTLLPEPDDRELKSILTGHLIELYRFYGEYMGARIARKHVGWYLQTLDTGAVFRRRFNLLETPEQQIESLGHFFNNDEYRDQAA